MEFTEQLLRDSNAVQKWAMQSLFTQLDSLCEGAIAVDRHARVVWINEKYVKTLGLNSAEEALGREIEEIIPTSLMRRVVETGQPILLDIMEFGNQSFVVTRMPMRNAAGEVIGAIGFVLYDRLQYLKPLVEKFGRHQADFVAARRKLAEHRRPKYTLASFVGGSPACLELKRQARRAAEHDTTVLLLGETGTGKELLAHAIHAASSRAAKPFIGVNMAAVPENLLESEFFGAAPGAYTGADRKGREGKFLLADGGTLFLDEVGDMPYQLQAKLLRVLQEQEVEPLGSNRVIKVDVRVIAATSVDLKRLVAEGTFRSDLFYRLNVLPIAIPPLRERLADLELLCEQILETISERTGLPRREITPTAIAMLATYDWPGNVRELRNVLEQVALLSDNIRLTAEDFTTIVPPAGSSRRDGSGQAVRRYDDALVDFERGLIQSALSAAGGKVEQAAHLLDVSRAALYKKIKKLGL
ncbi:MAG: sigma 54-interacting transcriptional regulator [Betaproteobacteria bacterium]|nr:sigma 54-interacting transcriptional regulator [Betaproteobacteria bacterium]